MSDIRIKDIGVFGELKNGIGMLGQSLPGVISTLNNALEGLKRDLLVDIKETEQEIEKQKKAASQAAKQEPGKAAGGEDHAAKISELNAKLGVLKNSFSAMDHLLIRSRQLNTKTTDILATTSKSTQALDNLEAIARAYLQLPASAGTSSNVQDIGYGKGFSTGKGIRMVGDTFHFNRGDQLSQMQVDDLERQVNQHNVKGNKISIDKVSSSDFTLLEKNGYTIQKIGPNDFSAFKMIDR